MKVKILEKEQIFNNEPESVRQILDCIYDLQEKQELMFSHITVDSVEVYDDFEDYLMKHINEIDTVEVVLLNREEFIGEMLISAEQYLDRAIPAVKILADRFYQGAAADAWGQFEQLLEALQWLSQVISIVEQNKQLFPSWESNISIAFSFAGILGNIDEAIKNKDLVLIADILNYELTPMLEKLSEDIQKTIDGEGLRSGTN